MDTITSSANPLLKRVAAAARGRERGFLVLEGSRLIEDAFTAGWGFDLVLAREDRLGDAEKFADAGIETRLVSASAMERVTTLVTPPGILALVQAPGVGTAADVSELVRSPQALVAVVAGIQDPGNLGALARTAEAAGASGLVVIEGGCSPWNPKALRGSMGSLLRLPIVCVESSSALLDALVAQDVRNVRAMTRDGVPLSAFQWSGRVALWISGETGGTTAPLDPSAFESVTIPMARGVESLNVTAAASVLLFATGRNLDPPSSTP